jgi:hypothetical protein
MRVLLYMSALIFLILCNGAFHGAESCIADVPFPRCGVSCRMLSFKVPGIYVDCFVTFYFSVCNIFGYVTGNKFNVTLFFGIRCRTY